MVLWLQLQVVLWMSLIGLFLTKAEVEIQPGRRCLALERQMGTLFLDTQDSFLLTFDVSSIPVSFRTRYIEEGDERGRRCLDEITQRVNRSLNSFVDKVFQFRYDNNVLDMYLLDPEFLGKSKRNSGGVIFAVLVSIANLFASGANIFMTMSKLEAFENRLDLMSHHIANLEANQELLQTNIDLLFEKDTFLGLQKNLIVEHLNDINNLHACDMLKLEFESQLIKFESHLNDILSAIYKGNLDHSLVDVDALHVITLQSYFVDTIYRMNPSLLYRFAKVEIADFSKNKLTVMVNFPRILRHFEFDYVNIIDANVANTVNHESLHSFLVPHAMDLTDIVNRLPDIRSADYCLQHNKFKACPDVALQSGCVQTILKGENNSDFDSCLGAEKKIGPYSLKYFDSGALIALRHGGRIKNVQTDRIIFETNGTNEELCIFLPKSKGIVLEWDNEQKYLFPSSRIPSYDVVPDFKLLKWESIVQPSKNLTLPVYVPSVQKAKPISRPLYVDYLYVIGISCASTLGALLLVLSICAILVYKRCVVDMSALYRT